MTALIRVVTVALALVVAWAAPVQAFDPEGTFARGTYVLSLEGGYGEQFDVEGFHTQSDLSFFNLGLRASLLPWGPIGSGALKGAFELGVEPFYQRYTDPTPAFWAGLAAVGRFHFLALGPFVPYAEVAAAAGGTDLRVLEIDSDLSFLLWGGVGASLFVTDSTALYAGYRCEHNSNGNTDTPNRGWESHVGVIGLSHYFR